MKSCFSARFSYLDPCLISFYGTKANSMISPIEIAIFHDFNSRLTNAPMDRQSDVSSPVHWTKKRQCIIGIIAVSFHAFHQDH